VNKSSIVHPAPSSQTGNSVNGRKPFISGAFDDFGLKPSQFRVVCRVARRGDCYESIPNMAAGCRLAVKTIKTVLKYLVSHNVLSKEKRPGLTCIYRVNSPGVWQGEPSPKYTLGGKQPDTQPQRHPNHPAQKTPYKGNPIKGKPVFAKRGKPGPGEMAYVKALENGASQKLLDQMCEPQKR
jgi:hypothetical protein